MLDPGKHLVGVPRPVESIDPLTIRLTWNVRVSSAVELLFAAQGCGVLTGCVYSHLALVSRSNPKQEQDPCFRRRYEMYFRRCQAYLVVPERNRQIAVVQLQATSIL